jgi:lysozyme
MARLALAALAVTAIVAAGLWFLAASWHPSDSDYPVQGIDVSHHQGAIDWAAVAGEGVDFAYIKASEGGDRKDPRFAANLRGANANGIEAGAYHFFTLCRPGADQATNFIATVPAGDDLLPPAVDLEFGGNCAARPPRPELLRELNVFLARIEAHSGRPALLYLTREFEQAYRVSEAIDRPLWLRSLATEPAYGARPWRIWQASNLRRIRGIHGRVDWNAMR